MKIRRLSLVLLALLLAAMAMVPMASADENYDKTLQKWQADHTIKVTKTVSEKYSDGILTEKISFTGTELTKRFGIDAFTLQTQVKVSAEDAKKLDLTEGKEERFTTETSGIFTAAGDPPLTAKAGYPIWLYAYSGGVYYQTGDPINLIWSGASLSTIKSEILEKGWYDGIWEEELYISDGGNWKVTRGVATSSSGVFGRDHLRLCQLYTGEVVGAAHSDSSYPHHAVAFETTEDLISTFFLDTDDTKWHVYPDNVDLGNAVTSPFSNRYAAYIGYW